jgi:diguanylate cyclase (GGDEF)-like protein
MKEFNRIRSAECGSFIVDRRGTILGFDQALEELTGWPAIEVVGRNKELGRSIPRDKATSCIASAPLYDNEIPMLNNRRSLELTLHCRDGRTLEAETIVRHMAGPGDRMLVTILRVLAISSGETAGLDQDRHDPLTTLPDAEAFAVRLASEFNTAATAAKPLALVLADIDHLREINDRLGHLAGDEVLQRVAGILRACVDDEAMLGRLGDDDFAILLPGSGRGEARQLASGLRSAVEHYHFFQDEEESDRTRVTLSLGSASFPADAERASDLMDRARDALDEARAMGRNRVWCYLRRPRVPLEVPVFFEGAEALLVGYTRDLSPSGIFVQTSVPIEIGMRCALAFPLPGRDSKVHVIGRVVRSVPPEISPDSQEMRIPGMGVEFERFGGATDRHAIEAYLHRHESTSLRPESGILSV